jgi:hypothetical protein
VATGEGDHPRPDPRHSIDPVRRRLRGLVAVARLALRKGENGIPATLAHHGCGAVFGVRAGGW